MEWDSYILLHKSTGFSLLTDTLLKNKCKQLEFEKFKSNVQWQS